MFLCFDFKYFANLYHILLATLLIICNYILEVYIFTRINYKVYTEQNAVLSPIFDTPLTLFHVTVSL